MSILSTAIRTYAKKAFIALGFDSSSGSFLPFRLSPNGNILTAPANVSISTTSASVGIAAATILAANGGRGYLLLQNRSTANIYIKTNGGVATVSGDSIRIRPEQSFIMESNVICQGEITAVADAAASILSVSEGQLV